MSLPNTTPVGTGSADVYTDFKGLAALKKSAKDNSPEAIHAVAKQYESLFTRMMIKSMREAVGKDPIFGSDQEQSYQEMYDDQLALELSKGKGLGLADVLVRQMQKLAGGSAQTEAAKAGNPQGAAGSAQTEAPQTQASRDSAIRLFRQNSSAGSADPQSDFISEVWPAAEAAGQELGVDPKTLVAQAALETNWGTKVPKGANGRSSNNLFGIKAGGQWSGASVDASTQEYENGSATTTNAQFRAYDSRSQSFQDYVSLLRGSPRYAAALNTGNNVQAFASALQQGGYATDPNYANKISAIASGISSHIVNRETALKSASAAPINPNTGTL
jgi:peptidoglycan hydrolase FlgJ